jgi:hypothetical protein
MHAISLHLVLHACAATCDVTVSGIFFHNQTGPKSSVASCDSKQGVRPDRRFGASQVMNSSPTYLTRQKMAMYVLYGLFDLFSCRPGKVFCTSQAKFAPRHLVSCFCCSTCFQTGNDNIQILYAIRTVQLMLGP